MLEVENYPTTKTSSLF